MRTRLADIVEDVEPLSDDSDIAELKSRKDLTSTDREQLILARRGQGQFRAGLDKVWDEACAVSGCTVREVLRASHILAWKLSSDKERLDPNNGLLLNATLDAMFDRGLISFKDDGAIMISELLKEADLERLGLKRAMTLRKLPLSAKQMEYLKVHRESFF